jgi:hypothetical protein
VFAYTTVVNIIERPDGVKIAAFFVSAIVIGRASMPYEMSTLDVRFSRWDNSFLHRVL